MQNVLLDISHGAFSDKHWEPRESDEDGRNADDGYQQTALSTFDFVRVEIKSCSKPSTMKITKHTRLNCHCHY